MPSLSPLWLITIAALLYYELMLNVKLIIKMKVFFKKIIIGTSMKELLKGEDGAILMMVVALVVVFVSILSTISLIGIVQTDHLQTQYQHDMLQEEILLRTEAQRTHLCIEFNKNRPLPDRIIEIISPERHTTYHIKNSKEITTISTFMGYATEQVVAVHSLITGKRAKSYISANKSPIKRYSERLLRNKSLAEYQYFTHIEESENADGGEEAARVKFYGYDELWGPVHSNDNIWIQFVGGWPTFHAMVTTAKRIMDYGTGQPAVYSAPMDIIFLGGYEEEVPPIIFEPDANDIRNYGLRPFIGLDADIVYVKINRTSFTSMYGQIDLVEIDTFGVYSWYPADADQVNAVIAAGGNWFEDSDHIWTNHIPIYDTTWTTGPGGSVNNQCVWVAEGEGQLWIEGEISGKQTWGCADTIFIVNDITYAGTTPGQPPDDPDNPNISDYFGLVSEKKILIRYKHRDPFHEMQIVDENCNSIYLYGAFAAIGKGDESIYGEMACHYDGIFTFQYHHPHGSTPNFIAPSPYISEEFTIILLDSGGDGWDDASLDVIVDGDIVLDDITCYSSQSTYHFTVDNGDVIQTVYTPGGHEDEHIYEIYDQNGELVASDGPFPGPGIMYQALLPPQEDTLYTYIDFHKFIYPLGLSLPPEIQEFELHGGDPRPTPYYMCGYPYESNAYLFSYPNNGPGYVYPYGTDWPWYNPIWPESAADIYNDCERGFIHMFGAIAQRRRGFVHRSGSDDYNHPQGLSSPSPWEIDIYRYDGDHPSTGYNKDYHFDDRFLVVQPPCYPQVYQGWGECILTAFDKRAWFLKIPPE
ncbi:MAG: hypothetical protein ISS28_03690 [Candidatus Cloacimonetes bacterium]|nr:hypothetical protein [Candidatus Cloacimonadota bacterium]